MKIEVVKNIKNIYYGDLCCGDVFYYDGAGSYYMVIDSQDDSGFQNSVSIKDGSLISFEDGEIILPVDAKLVVEHKQD